MELTNNATMAQNLELLRVEMADWIKAETELNARIDAAKASGEAGREFDVHSEFEAAKAAWLERSNCVEIAKEYQVGLHLGTERGHRLVEFRGEMINSYSRDNAKSKYTILSSYLDAKLIDMMILCQQKMEFGILKSVNALQYILTLKEAMVPSLRVEHNVEYTVDNNCTNHEHQFLVILKGDLHNLENALITHINSPKLHCRSFMREGLLSGQVGIVGVSAAELADLAGVNITDDDYDIYELDDED